MLRDLDLFAGRPVQLGVTLTTLDERLAELWEPGAASVDARLKVLEAARHAGLETSVMLGPLLPFLSDSQAAIEGLLDRVADLGVARIWVDGLNPRPRVWPAVAELLLPEVPRTAATLSPDPLRSAVTRRDTCKSCAIASARRPVARG